MKKLAWLAGVVTVAATGTYIFVYLYRWEWHRAIIVATFFIAAELALSCSLVIRRVGMLEARLRGEERRPPADPAVLHRLRDAAPGRDHFAWLQTPMERAGVFMPVLLGSGVIVSAVAWAVERVAGRTVHPGMERGLARQLSEISFPAGGLIRDDAEVLIDHGRSRYDEHVALLLGPRVR